MRSIYSYIAIVMCFLSNKGRSFIFIIEHKKRGAFNILTSPVVFLLKGNPGHIRSFPMFLRDIYRYNNFMIGEGEVGKISDPPIELRQTFQFFFQ